MSDDRTAATETGSLIGEAIKPPPGLATLAKRLREIESEVAQAEGAKHELDQVRGTLLLNFGVTTHNRYGFVVSDDGSSTMGLLMRVLTEMSSRMSSVGSKEN